MPKNRLFTKTELRLKMEKAMKAMEQVIDDKESTPNQKIYAGNNLSGIIKQYKDQFGVEEKTDGSKLKSVKNF